MQDCKNPTNALDTLRQPRHRWYFVKEGFSPNLVNQAIEDSKCKNEDLVIDVFCGGGTTTLAATMKGHTSAGFEVNPFLAFVARTKLLNCRAKTLDRHIETVVDGAQNGATSRLDEFSTFSENGKVKKWLFNKDILSAFEGGWKNTQNLHAPVRDLFRLCLIGAAMDVCNAVRDGKCLRYRKNWQQIKYKEIDFIDAFYTRVSHVKQDLDSYPLRKSNNYVLNIDSRKLTISALKGKPFKLCVTSPPYLNSFDYTDIYRPELFLGKYVKSQAKLRELRLNTLRSHVQVKWNAPNNDYLSLLLKQSVSDIQEQNEKLWNSRIPMMIQAYFEDMGQILGALKSFAARDAQLWIVVANSAYVGIEVPVDLIISDIGSKCGWSLKEIKVVSYLRRTPGQQCNDLSKKNNKGPHLRESLIIFENQSRIKRYTINLPENLAHPPKLSP